MNTSFNKQVSFIFISLTVIIVVVCLLVSLLIGWIFIANSKTIDQRPANGSNRTIVVVTPPVQYVTEEISTIAPLQSAPTPTGDTLSLSEATLPSEPSPTATPVVVPTPTSSPTQTPTEIPTATSLPTATPIPIPTPVKIEHVVIISVDGLRPDALDNADTPTLDTLRPQGAYSTNTQTVIPTATLIGHASMLGGMTPEKHGIYWDLYTPELGKINGPTLFSVAHDAGLRTAMVVGKIKLEQVYLPHALGHFDASSTTDILVRDRAIEIIQDPVGLPTILFIHLPDVDTIGHEAGWMSPEQLAVVHQADARIGEIRAALEGAGYWTSTLLIVTADHGGHDKTHLVLPPLPEDITIPWLAVGPGVSVGKTLTSDIHIYDTAATALYALGLPIPEEWDGKPILEIFN